MDPTDGASRGSSMSGKERTEMGEVVPASDTTYGEYREGEGE